MWDAGQDGEAQMLFGWEETALEAVLRDHSWWVGDTLCGGDLELMHAQLSCLSASQFLANMRIKEALFVAGDSGVPRPPRPRRGLQNSTQTCSGKGELQVPYLTIFPF